MPAALPLEKTTFFYSVLEQNVSNPRPNTLLFIHVQGGGRTISGWALVASHSMLWCLDGRDVLICMPQSTFHYRQTLLKHNITQCTAVAAKVNN